MFPYDRRRSQICDLRSAIIWRPAFMFYLLRSSAIVCDHDRRIADDRRSMFPYDRRRSQTLLRSAICDPRSYGNQPLRADQFELLKIKFTFLDLLKIKLLGGGGGGAKSPSNALPLHAPLAKACPQ